VRIWRSVGDHHGSNSDIGQKCDETKISLIHSEFIGGRRMVVAKSV